MSITPVAVLVIMLVSAGLGALVAVLAGGLQPGPQTTEQRPLAQGSLPPSPSSPSAAAATAEVRGVVSIDETFDDFAMGTTLEGPWTVTGGKAEIVALPTSVDRSVRIWSYRKGGSTRVCRHLDALPGSKISVRFEFMWKPTPTAVVTLLTFRHARADIVALQVDPGGSPVQEPGWQRLDAVLDTTFGQLTWQTDEVADAGATSGSAAVTLGSARPDELCLLSPSGSSSGWVAIDDLHIEG